MSKINVIGKMSGYEIANRVYNSNGLSPTIRTYGGGGLEPKIMEVLKIKQATNKGYTECVVGGVADLSYPLSETRRGRVIENGRICPTIMTGNIPSVLERFIYEIDGDTYLIRIRKLTPRECWRLMGFSDRDFDRAAEVNSNTQLYKQAGNSIVVNVLEAIFRELFIPNARVDTLKQNCLDILNRGDVN